MSDYIVETKSRRELRSLALTLRDALRIRDKMWVPIVKLLDVFCEIFDDFSYEIVEDGELKGGAHAETDIITGHIKINESVYEGACNDEGRDRMTIAHEIAHFFTLRSCGFKLQRNFNHKEVKPYNDPEWQAKCFAGEFMIPSHLIGDMSVQDIANACGVSYEAALYQFNHRD